MNRARKSLELWGGIECTVNRVGDCYYDQLEFCGHAERPHDLPRILELGFSAFRYPLLWEKCAPHPHGLPDFGWATTRLELLRERGARPIVGLLHHGSGPRHTSLLDLGFAEKLAGYAERVAERFPWVEAYTPVNEPLTTARFSALYGHWYPHARNDASFVRALYNQVWGTVLSMRAIRSINPAAQLIQTEDLGHVRSTPDLAYQADFENERRFLGLDLLCGSVNRDHPLWHYVRAAGISELELERLLEWATPPDVLGFNYYVTSERFLDSRIAYYPSSCVGGNGEQRYADVEAVRVCEEGLVGAGALLLEAHRRFGRPVAITEAHLAGPSDEQVRWLAYVLHEVERARALGADVKAVTVWCLLGAYGWDTLVTRGKGTYESGAFTLESGRPEPTPLANFVKALTQGAAHVVHGGWWQCPERILYRFPARVPRLSEVMPAGAAERLLEIDVRIPDGVEEEAASSRATHGRPQ